MPETSSYSSRMAGPDVVCLKEAIRTQQILLQKLYSELDEEREASSTAASEALSMILRVQEEKAAVTMEASQYKRMTEEKMHHVEKSLLMFKELMYQKEMQVASLECQVQSYRYKMLSLGCGDSFADGYGENEDIHGNIRRNNSLPSVQFNEIYPEGAIVEIEGSVFPMEEVYPYKFEREHSHDSDYYNEDIKSYWEQIKQLNERVAELSHGSDVDNRIDTEFRSAYRVLRSAVEVSSEGLETGSRTCSIPSEGNAESFYKPIIESLDSFNYKRDSAFSCSSSRNEEQAIGMENEAEVTRNGVQDIFEVPQNHEIRRRREERLVKPESAFEGTSECHSKVEAELLKNKNKLPISSDAQSEIDIKQLSKRLEQLEGERNVPMHKHISDRWEEELRLLKEIHEKLETVQDELHISKAKTPPLEDSSVVSMMEEMWMFSL